MGRFYDRTETLETLVQLFLRLRGSRNKLPKRDRAADGGLELIPVVRLRKVSKGTLVQRPDGVLAVPVSREPAPRQVCVKLQQDFEDGLAVEVGQADVQDGGRERVMKHMLNRF